MHLHFAPYCCLCILSPSHLTDHRGPHEYAYTLLCVLSTSSQHPGSLINQPPLIFTCSQITDALVSAARDAGADIRTGARVTRINTSQAGTGLGGMLTGVEGRREPDVCHHLPACV